MVQLDLGTAVGLLLTAGGAAFVGTLLRGWRDMRAGSRAGQREVVQDLIEWRDDLDKAYRNACTDRDFWRDLAASRGGQLRQLGHAPDNPEPIPPSERPEDRPPTRNKRRTTPP